MARLVTVGFETGATESNSTTWLVSVSASEKRTGSYGLQITCGTGVGQGYWSYNLGSSEFIIYGRWAQKFAAAGINQDTLHRFYDENGDLMAYIWYDGSLQQWKFSVYGEEADAIGSTVIEADRWYVYEFYYDPANQFTLKVDGVTDLTFLGVASQTVPMRIRRVQFQGSFGATFTYIDDVAINTPDGSFQNSYPGIGGIFLLKPNGDGDVLDFTPSAGTDHYAMVDEVPSNTTDWVQALDEGSQELFDIEDTPEYVTQINVVQPIFKAAIAVSGSNTLRDIVKDATTIYPGDEDQAVLTIAPAYALYRGKVYYEQPDGVSGAFDAAALDALQVGFEIPEIGS